MKQTITILALLALFGQLLAQGGGRIIFPEDPVEKAKRLQVEDLLNRAKALVASHDDHGAITVLQEAAAVEASIRSRFQANAEYDLARMYVKLNRIPDALEAYRRSFAWNPKRHEQDGVCQGDLDINGPDINGEMEYAILLAQAGRAEDAKAMYYFALRAHMFEAKSRSQEPAPFLVVFDPEPEGIQWDYTPERLEAAAWMLRAILSSSSTDFATNVTLYEHDFVERARQLAPDWFYPALYLANHNDYDSPRRQQLMAEAESLAKPGLEQQLVEQFRRDLAEWQHICEQNDTPDAYDDRSLTEGAARRKRMQCLRPNEQVLRRLSVEMPH